MPVNHKIYARLVDKTYSGDRERFGNYEFRKSLNIPNTMISAFIGGGTGALSEFAIRRGVGRALREPVGIFSELAGYDARPQINFLTNLFDVERVEQATGRIETIYLTPDDTGLDEFIPVETPETEFYYIPQIPKGLGSVLFGAIAYQKGLNNLKASEEPQRDVLTRDFISPRINYYRDSINDEDVFAIRGTNSMEDIINDGLLVADKVSPMIDKKLQLYEEFIRENAKTKKITLTGHSLGSVEMSMLMDRMTDYDIKGIGFGHPVFKPHKNAIVYSFRHDPLYVPNGEENHKVLEKPFAKKIDRFANHHALKNYF